MMRYSVSEITGQIKNLIERNYSSLEIEGEISNCKFSSTGHLYFSLKDNLARLQCVLFRSSLARVPFMPEDGQRVVASGSLSVYPPSGSYQLVCRSLDLAGEGEILKMLEERKRRLSALGYFDKDNKRALPRFPRRIAVVTSQNGAAIRDILHVLKRRNSRLHIMILPSPVQGSDAGRIIASQVRFANKNDLCDVIIVARGGGALEDLLPFSEERVVKAIYDSKIPVVSGIGHEIDWALSDFAADVRAPTPSAAAEIVTGEIEGLDEYIRRTKEYLLDSAFSYCRLKKLQKERISIDSLTGNMLRRTGNLSFFIDDIRKNLTVQINTAVQQMKTRIALVSTELEAKTPEKVMKRGYAIITRSGCDTKITSAAAARLNDALSIYMHDGRFETVVTEPAKEKNKR